SRQPWLRSLRGFGCLHYSLAHSGIGPAAAEVAAKPVLNFLKRRTWIPFEEGFCRHHESRRAEAALLRVMIDKGLLNGMKLARLTQAFNGGDLPALGVDGQHRAGVHRLVVHQHGASAAGAAIANPLGAGKLKFVSQPASKSHRRLS